MTVPKKTQDHKYPEVVMPKCPLVKYLTGQKALVTGAATGIGRSIAMALGQAGADVVVNYLSRDEMAEEAVRDIQKSGTQAYAHKADVSKEDQVKEMFDKMIKTFGTVDILINNAGIQADAPFDEMTLGQWQKVIDVNLTGQFLCTR